MMKVAALHCLLGLRAATMRKDHDLVDAMLPPAKHCVAPGIAVAKMPVEGPFRYAQRSRHRFNAKSGCPACCQRRRPGRDPVFPPELPHQSHFRPFRSAVPDPRSDLDLIDLAARLTACRPPAPVPVRTGRAYGPYDGMVPPAEGTSQTWSGRAGVTRRQGSASCALLPRSGRQRDKRPENPLQCLKPALASSKQKLGQSGPFRGRYAHSHHQ